MPKNCVEAQTYVPRCDYRNGARPETVEVNIYSIAKSLTPEILASLLDDYCNTFSAGYKRGLETGKALQQTHRTLQRSVIGELTGIIAGMVVDERWTDARNKHAIEFARKVKELYDENGIGMMV